ncbi:ACP S-malonyltransferase [Chitinophaga japonensis]|uniref:[acyl-carrier-protein] S-malonyltransferase n=1 Tax=Chitinophaga japonensis TaxID=104662 RepID=A0A562SLE8_CHIJA|nr:ACP S-malonyltransferase [Chitinophaga japonensis]TWI82121.1 [acyl-carrier-protein] S-malonyltransferase [Chitinophaga japonensis]
MLKTALLFPGQGAQYPGMGRQLYKSSAIAREVYEQASDALGMDMKKRCFEGSEYDLQQTALAQPAILTTSVAFFRHFIRQEIGCCPQYLAGHSLGEYTALCCAGALQLDDAVRLVHQRGRLMQDAVSAGEGDMAAISGLTDAQVAEICTKVSGIAPAGLWIAAYNLNAQVVIAGSSKQVAAAMQQCVIQGGEAVRLKVSAPFHTPLMSPAADKLLEVLSACCIGQLQCPVIANVTGLPYTDETMIMQGLYTQMTQPVQWRHTLEYLHGQGVGYFIDAGPRKLLRNQVRNHGMRAAAYALEDPADIDALRENIGSNVAAVVTPLSKAMAIAVSTRNRNHDEEAYEAGVITPFRKMKQLQELVEQERRLPLAHEVKAACRQLWQVLQAKQLPPSEARGAYRRLCFETGATLVWPELKEMEI